MLRKKREELGAEEDIPLFLVASNRTLQEMAAQLPSTMSELLHIHGIGPSKAQKYGQKFLSVISEYCKERGRNNFPK